MTRRKYRVRRWSAFKHYDAPIVLCGVEVPGDFTIEHIRSGDCLYGLRRWLPPSLLPITDSDEWVAQALPFLTRAVRRNRRAAA